MKNHTLLRMIKICLGSACVLALPTLIAQESPPAEQPPETAPAAASDSAPHPRYQSLIERSPFLTREYLEQQNRNRSRGAGDLLFHGFVQIDADHWLLSIQDRRTQSSHWLKVGDTIRDVTLEKFDPQTRKLTVRIGDVSSELSIVPTEN